MLRICDHPDCSTLTLGGYCPRHEPPQANVRFPRGRPFPHHRDAGSVGVAAAAAPLTRGYAQTGAVSFGGGT
jgi:hypothetical protein